MPPLDFAAFEARLAAVPPPDPACVEAGIVSGSRSGGVALAYELHRPAAPWRDLLVFYHGGGVNMRAGYDRLAAALTRQSVAQGMPLAICLTDIRGHGRSGGRRGHSARPECVWDDVGRLLATLAAAHPGVRLHLGGHSSGAGLLINALTRRPLPAVASLALLAPNFGYHAALDSAESAFAGASTVPFAINWFSGGRLAGGMPAVTLDFAGSGAAARLGFVDRYTVNMALAVTPTTPGAQLARLPVPTWIGIARADEVSDPVKTAAFVARHAPHAKCVLLPGIGHLDAVLDGAPALFAGLRGLGVHEDVPSAVQV